MTGWSDGQTGWLIAVVYDGNIHTVIDLAAITGFDWDRGNARKTEAHGVTQTEAEQVFFNEPLLLTRDAKHSGMEPRYRALGRTDGGRLLTIVVTIRGKGTLVRVISAREMNRHEKKEYKRAQANEIGEENPSV